MGEIVDTLHNCFDSYLFLFIWNLSGEKGKIRLNFFMGLFGCSEKVGKYKKLMLLNS